MTNTKWLTKIIMYKSVIVFSILFLCLFLFIELLLTLSNYKACTMAIISLV